MKKNYFSLFLVMTVLSCKQTNPSTTSDEIIDCAKLIEIDGKWLLNHKPYTGNCESYEHGKLQSYAEFKNGHVHGTMIYYFPNGQENEIVQWTEGIANGSVKYFYENGQLAEEGQVIQNSKEGIWKSYHPNGNPKALENWKNNVIQDSVFSYFANGNLHSKGIFIDGKEHGRWIMYDSISGKIDGYLLYENGKPIAVEKY